MVFSGKESNLYLKKAHFFVAKSYNKLLLSCLVVQFLMIYAIYCRLALSSHITLFVNEVKRCLKRTGFLPFTELIQTQQTEVYLNYYGII